MLRTYQPKKTKKKRAWLQEKNVNFQRKKGSCPSSCKGTQAFDRIAGNSEKYSFA